MLAAFCHALGSSFMIVSSDFQTDESDGLFLIVLAFKALL
jgi:hypothetical protein